MNLLAATGNETPTVAWISMPFHSKAALRISSRRLKAAAAGGSPVALKISAQNHRRPAMNPVSNIRAVLAPPLAFPVHARAGGCAGAKGRKSDVHQFSAPAYAKDRRRSSPVLPDAATAVGAVVSQPAVHYAASAAASRASAGCRSGAGSLRPLPGLHHQRLAQPRRKLSFQPN